MDSTIYSHSLECGHTYNVGYKVAKGEKIYCHTCKAMRKVVHVYQEEDAVAKDVMYIALSCGHWVKYDAAVGEKVKVGSQIWCEKCKQLQNVVRKLLPI